MSKKSIKIHIEIDKINKLSEALRAASRDLTNT